MDHTKIFNWKAPKVVDGLKTVFAAILLSLVLNNLVQWLGLNQMLQVELPKLLMEDSLVGVLTSLTLIALIPGIVEELLFRGVIFKGLRSQYNFPLAAIISSVMFAAIHFSFFRLGHTFIAGLVLAYIYEKRSILSCFLFHITFNATAVLGSSITKLGEALTLELSFLSIIAVSIASIGIGYLIRLKKVPQSATEVIEENQKLVA